jgi:3-oxoacyl-[acyl-carrier-protein] synthase-3
VLFGDGAGAVVLGSDSDGATLLDHILRIDGEGLDLIELPGGGSRIPASAESIANNQHFLKLEGPKVFRFAVKVIHDSVTELLERNGYTIDDLDLLIPHQANLRIIEAITKRIDIPEERVFVNLHKYGNTSAAACAIALDEAHRAGRFGPGDHIVLVAFGAGLTWAAAAVRW